MRITDKDTVADIINARGALFVMGAKKISEALEAMPEVSHVPMRRRWWRDKQYNAPSIAGISLGELEVLNTREPAEEYFYNVMGIMLGLVHFEGSLPDGAPDWNAGYTVNKDAVNNLRFIPAMRYFLQIQKELENVSKAWKKLGAWNKKKGKARPNRGLISVVRQYCQDLNGAVSLPEAWNVPWTFVYEDFETKDIENREQHEALEESKRKSKSKR